VYTPEFCILDNVYSTRRSVEGKVANTMETGSRNYVTIVKGREYVYAYENHLYCRVKSRLTEGRTKCLWTC